MSEVENSERIPHSESIATFSTTDDEPRSRRRRDLLSHDGIQPAAGSEKGSQQHLKKLEPLDISKHLSVIKSKIARTIILI